MTTAVERCTNARGRMQTVGAACWERCSSPPHWSSRECDTLVRSHGTAEAEYADICSLVCFLFLCVRFGAEVHESCVRGFKHRNYSYSKICSHVHTHTHTLWSSLHTKTVLDRSDPHPPCLLYLVKSYW